MALFEKDTLTDHVGTYRTLSLYRELNTSNLEPVLTLKEVDYEYKGKILPSLHRIYMDIADPTEYEVAMHVFGSWRCWNRQLNSKVIIEHIAEWRDQLEVKLRSDAIRAITQASTAEGTAGVGAARYLAERGWEKRAGRPSKLEIERQKKIHAGINGAVEDDAERMGVH